MFHWRNLWDPHICYSNVLANSSHKGNVFFCMEKNLGWTIHISQYASSPALGMWYRYIMHTPLFAALGWMPTSIRCAIQYKIENRSSTCQRDVAACPSVIWRNFSFTDWAHCILLHLEFSCWGHIDYTEFLAATLDRRGITRLLAPLGGPQGTDQAPSPFRWRSCPSWRSPNGVLCISFSDSEFCVKSVFHKVFPNFPKVPKVPSLVREVCCNSCVEFL